MHDGRHVRIVIFQRMDKAAIEESCIGAVCGCAVAQHCASAVGLIF